MTPRDELAARLERLITELAAADAPELLAEARENARARARAVLEDALTEQLLEHAAGKQAESRSRRAEPAPEAGAPPPAPAPAPGSPTGLYAYGVLSASAGVSTGDLVGVDSHAGVSLVTEGDLAAVVTPVSLAEFGEEALKANLNEMSWLEATARAHESVVDRLVARATLVPMRLCTVFRDEDGVRAMLASEGPVLADALQRLDGTTEWGVKALADPTALARAAAGEEPVAEDLSEGARYLASRRRERLAAEEVDRLASVAVGEAHARLAEEARDATVHPAQSRELSGHTGEMLLNGSYLVEDDRVESFRALVDALAERYRPLGFSFELTGPWPPYNFVASRAARAG